MCAAAGARALALTHHDPLRGDDGADRIAGAAAAALGPGCPLRVFAAAEGAEFDLAGDAAASAAGGRAPPTGAEAAPPADRTPAALVQ